MDTMTLAVRVSKILGREVDRFYLRGMLRVMFPEGSPGRGGEWDVTERQVRVVEDCFRRLRAYDDGAD